MITNEWEEFFDGHAPEYMQNVFTRDTAREAAFLEELLALPPGARLLDIGCGTGRHAIEMARRGYAVTGIDLSAGMLAEARQAAAQAGVTVEWIKADATRFLGPAPFDAAVCLCEGALCLLGSGDDVDEHDRAILRSALLALRPGGSLILTALNGLAKIRQFTPEDVKAGRFDPMTLVETFEVEWESPQGKRSLRVRERGYLPAQLAERIQEAGFVVEHVWGGTAGAWGRRPVELDEIEMMIVAHKPA